MKLTKDIIGIIISALIIFLWGCSKNNNPSPPVVNSPVANAGLHRAITRPLDSVILVGSGTETNGVISSYMWSQASGPMASLIENPSSATTNILFKHSGTYIFQLTVTDSKGVSGTDTVSILVIPSANDTLISQPNKNPMEVHIWGNPSLDESWNGFSELNADTWTSDGAVIYVRGAFAFDLSSISKAATVQSATLNLYSSHTPQNGNLIDANFGTNDSMVVQEISQSWVAANVHWNTQPSTTTTNQILIPATTFSFLDLSLDASAIVTDMIQNNNYGFMMKLQNEQPYTSRIFCSSFYSDSTRHPQLIVVYKFE
jgi:hypothetical protein